MSSDLSPSIGTPMVDRMARSAHSAIDRMADTANSAVGRVRSGVTDTLHNVSDRMEGFTASRDHWMDNCRQTVREHPVAAVGVCLAAGYLIARWLRS
jgi:ElaB/YqjD/DUF883 family membrane-anchored ribosome-binding protein